MLVLLPTAIRELGLGLDKQLATYPNVDSVGLAHAAGRPIVASAALGWGEKGLAAY
jgi:hypothetical protein